MSDFRVALPIAQTLFAMLSAVIRLFPLAGGCLSDIVRLLIGVHSRAMPALLWVSLRTKESKMRSFQHAKNLCLPSCMLWDTGADEGILRTPS